MLRLIATTLIIFMSLSLLGSASVVHGILKGSIQQINFTFPTDYISGNSISYPVSISEDDGAYAISVEIDSPIAGVVSIGDWSMPIFIHPNDTLDLSFIQYGDGYLHQAQGTFSDDLDFLSELYQLKASSEDVVYAMASKEVDEYNSWLTERYNRIKASYLQHRSSGSFSPEFEIYINAEIDYTYAYYLLRYRMEYPIANDLVPPLKLPIEYIESINTVIINNENAIVSPAYRKFIAEYINLTREIDSKDQLFLIEENFEVISKTSPLFAQPDVPPIYQSVEKGEIVKFLGQRSDFKSKSRIGGEMSEDYWYNVKLSNGRQGWLLGHTINKVEKATSQNQNPIHREVTTISKVETKAIAIYNNLEVFNDPHERKVIKILGYGYEMDYPHVSTTEVLAYKFKGINRLGKFVMVDINGEIGWVFEQGIKTQRKVIQSSEQRQVVTLAALKDYSSLDQFLLGTPLFYIIAEDLNNRIQYAQDENLKRDIENFINISDDEYINKYIQFHYNEIYGTELDFGLTKEDIRLVRLNSSEQEKESITTTYTLNNDIEIHQNYVVLPSLENSTNTFETRISLSDGKRMIIHVVSDPLSGGLTNLDSYDNGTTGSISYDQIGNELAFIKVNNKKQPLYLTAGADIDISLDGEGNLLFNESDKENAFITAYHGAFSKRDQSVTQRVRSAKESDFKTFISSLAKQKLTFLKAKQEKWGLDQEFVTDISYDINYWLGYQLLRYTQEHSKYDKTWSLPKDANNYYDFLSQMDKNPVNRTLGSNYRSFIQAYLTHLHGQISNRNKLVKELIEEKFNGYSYYYLMALELYADVFKGDPVSTGKDIAHFTQLNPYPTLNHSLTKVYNANLPLRAGIAAPYFELKDRKGRVVRQSELIGKIVVLDFWATWCAPCLEKMRTDRNIWSKYSEDDVVFLYVSLDNSKSTWQRFLSNNPSLQGEHAFPKGQQIAFDSPIAQTYKISSIPAFYIIGKDGNLAYNPFTTLSPARIRDHIDNLLYPR